MNINQPAENLTLPFVRPRKINLDNEVLMEQNRRLSAVRWMPSPLRTHIVAVLGEFVGTFMFLFFAFAAVTAVNTATADATAAVAEKIPVTANLLYVALAFGFSLAVNAWVFFRITGGLFNPAVTLALCLTGALTWVRGILVSITQIVGAIAASAVVSGLFPGPLSVQTTLNPQTSVARGLFIEMFLTAELIFTIFMLAAEKHKATFIAPVGIGLALFICALAGGYFTGGSLNPARSFGPAVIDRHFYDYHWIYWVGPFLGSLVAVAFYKLVKKLEYECVNPGQDADDKEAERFVNDEPTPAFANSDQSSRAQPTAVKKKKRNPNFSV